MSKRPGDTFGFQFTTKGTLGLVNADAPGPVGTVVRNGVDDPAVTVTIANVSAGLYKATGTIPGTYVSGDDVQVRVNASVATVPGAGLHDYGTLRSYLELATAITDVKTATVGGALNGAWSVAWGRALKDLTNRLLKVWGATNGTATPSATFTLDDPNNPTTRTPN